MKIQPQIKKISQKKLVGKKVKMSLANNRTIELWRSFMPVKNKILNTVNNDLISLQVYDSPLIPGNLQQEFEKWALVEVEIKNHSVSNQEDIPNGMEIFILLAGLYAVFNYKGLSADTRIFKYIFSEWLPQSDYVVDKRPHFEVLGERYKNNDPNSEEEIWIPIKAKL